MVLKKFELEGALAQESLMIKSGVLKDENPLDTSEEFNDFLLACRHGDLKKCQELISQGVNINGKDKFDYTPLIIVSLSDSRLYDDMQIARAHHSTHRPVYVGISNLSSYY
jgi:ankyrin repeat and BTB/POZ domain-containing protein 1